MKVSEEQMATTVAWYLNRELFLSDMSRSQHRSVVTKVKQRDNAFVIEFEGGQEPQWKDGESDKLGGMH